MEREYVDGKVVKVHFDPAWPQAGYKFVIEYDDMGHASTTNRYSSRQIYHLGDTVRVGWRIKGQPEIREQSINIEDVKAWLDRTVHGGEEPPLFFHLEANGRRYTYMRE